MSEFGYGFEVRYQHEHNYKGKFHRTVVHGSTVTVQWGPLQYIDQYVSAMDCTYKEHEMGTAEAAAKKAASLVSSKVTKGYRPVGDLIAFPDTSGWALQAFLNEQNRFERHAVWNPEETIDLIEADTSEDVASYLLAILALGNSITSDVALRLSEHSSLAVRKAVSRHVTLAALL